MTRPNDVLRLPVLQAVRSIALGCLDEAGAALERAQDPHDREALHDFRVALRRLRTTLRAYRPLLPGGVPRRLRRRLRELADVTNPARDAEVALTWLRPLETELQSHDRIGLRALVGRIEHRRAKHLPRSLAEAGRCFASVDRKLRKILTVPPSKPDAPRVLFGSVAAATLLGQAKRLDQLIASVSGPDDDAVHRARIAAKRLRYQLEPVAAALSGGGQLIERLRKFQDLLGELHDLVELQEAVRSEPKTTAVARRVRARRAFLYTELKRDWLGNTGTWTQDIAAATGSVSRPRRTPARPWRRPRHARTV